MSRTDENSGVCATCALAPGCVYRRASAKPVFNCELFEVPPAARRKTRTRRRVPAAGERAAVDSLQGLCANCEVRRSCTLPKHEGGIWHCEEYR